MALHSRRNGAGLSVLELVRIYSKTLFHVGGSDTCSSHWHVFIGLPCEFWFQRRSPCLGVKKTLKPDIESLFIILYLRKLHPGRWDFSDMVFELAFYKRRTGLMFPAQQFLQRKNASVIPSRIVCRVPIPRLFLVPVEDLTWSDFFPFFWGKMGSVALVRFHVIVARLCIKVDPSSFNHPSCSATSRPVPWVSILYRAK